MTVLRFAARTMLASYFVVNGIKAVRNPSDFADATAVVAEKVLPAVRGALPEEARSLLPEDASGVARWFGVAQIAGGLGLATGFGRRIGAGLLAVTTLPKLIGNNPIKAAADQRAKFGAEVALLGGVVLASLDTEGQPNLAWKVRTRQQLAASKVAQRKAELARATDSIATDTAKRARRFRKQVTEALS